MTAPHAQCQPGSRDDGLTNIDRVRLALAMTDAGYPWEVEAEYVEALLSDYDRLTERCEAYKGQVEAGAAEIERLYAQITRAQSPVGWGEKS